MRYSTRIACGAVAVLFCLGAMVADAQQGGSATARPSPQTTPPAPTPLDVRVKASERAIDESIPNDPAVDAVLAPYTMKVRELDVPIGKLVGELKKGGMGAGSLGNFVADAMRIRSEAKLGKPVLLAITNSGGLRKNEIAEGNLSAIDIYQLLPFENALVVLDLTGEQLQRFLNVIVKNRDAQSGAQITYRTNEKNENEVASVKLGTSGAGADIDPQAVYTIVTIDYLVKRGGDYLILQEAKNVRPLGLTIRDVVLDYVKAETAAGRSIKSTLDGRFRSEKAGETKTEDTP